MSNSQQQSNNNVAKLHPIYNALDHQQYNRAIKLCLQHPSDNWYAQALLAHAYAKSEQRPKALQVLHKILIGTTAATTVAAAATTTTTTTTAVDNPKTTKDYFVELQLAHEYAQTGNADHTAAAPSAAEASAASRNKGGKKGKKKPAAAPKAAATAPETAATSSSSWDWIDVLDTAPALCAETFHQVPPWPVPVHLADYHLLHTMQLTLLQLRCTLTAYQLYAWWAATLTATTTTSPAFAMDPADVVTHLRETFGLGLAVWMAPQYQHLPARSQVLAALQVLALQIARMETTTDAATTTTITSTPTGTTTSIATLWAAQTALWQCQTDEDTNEPPAANKLALLPRLAESLALKMVQQGGAHDQTTTRIAAEAFLLWGKALQTQDKWTEYLQAVQERLDAVTATTNPPLGLTPAMLLDYKAQALQQLQQTEQARETVATSLRQQNPDQWNMWMRHLDLDNTDGYQATVALARELTLPETQEGEKPAYPRRGPPLVILEALRRRIEKASEDGTAKEALMKELLDQIQSYGNAFASRTACTFSDLQACLDCICNEGGATKAAVLLPWLQTMQAKPSAEDSSQRRAQLRAFIFGHQTTLKILDRFPELHKDWLPNWKSLVVAWKEFQSYEDDFKAAQTEDERMNAQKESRPADEVILLAVQLLLAEDSTPQGLILAATLLEKAIVQSPHNAYLKLSQIFICADLNATSRSWDLFRELFIKHIQHESCAYLILPLLRAGGMYQEILMVCKEIIRLQITALRDANEFTGKALENGTLSQADEFICFQRNRMNKSLTTLEAKGLIMDCAPMFKHDDRQIEIGSSHGIVGGDMDTERAQKMISEAHFPQGTFTLLRLKGGVQDNLPRLSENRDLNALEYEVFRPHVFPTQEEVVADCIRRSHHHSLLLRAALCIDATKGPKKGKAVKPTVELAKRCKSLIARVNEAQAFAETELKTPAGYGMMMVCMTKLCRAIAVLSGGFVAQEPSSDDSVSFREEQTASFLREAVETLQSARDQLNLSASAAQTGQALPDVILPVLALLNMCAKVNDLYGWTKKRRTIRKCSGCLYDFVMAFKVVLDDMSKSLESAQLENEGFELPSTIKEGVIPAVVSDEDVRETVFLIHGAQGQTKTRIERIVNSIRSDLESFETEE